MADATKGGLSASMPPRHRRAETVREVPTYARDHPDRVCDDGSHRALLDCIGTIESILDGPAASTLTSRQASEIKLLRRRVGRAARTRHGSYGTNLTRSLLVPSEVMADLDRPQFAHIAANFGGVDVASAVRYAGRSSRNFSCLGKVELSDHSLEGACRKKPPPPRRSGTGLQYVPPEWDDLTVESKTRLADMLSWGSLAEWGLDPLKVARLSLDTTDDGCGCAAAKKEKKKSCPLLLLGWAILGSPHSQRQMRASIGEGGAPSEDEARAATATATATAAGPAFGYDFTRQFGTCPETLCSFLRAIEGGYKQDIPYHNNVHAADVLQTTHALLQFAGPDLLTDLCRPLDVYSVLLAAAVHDVGHPGTNNCFQVHARTDLAIRYNDRSVLENMHASRTFQLLMGASRRPGVDVLGGLSDEEAADVRRGVIDAVLGTDMSQHFAAVAHMEETLRSLDAPPSDGGGGGGGWEAAAAPGSSGADGARSGLGPALRRLGPGKERDKVAGEVLRYVLHLADISNAAKPRPVATQWADGALREFFSQGDREKELGLPVSPLCDRETTDRAESQIGFIKFVVRPAYELLARIIPRVGEDVLPEIGKNLEHWELEKKLS